MGVQNVMDDLIRGPRTVATIQFVSDIHLEYRDEPYWWTQVIIPRSKYLVLAGDIAPATHPFLPYFYLWCKDNFEKVVHVPGNHEYWRHGKNKPSMRESEEIMKDLCRKCGIIYCQKGIIELENTPGFPKIVGCTLWANVPDEYKYNPDFSSIKDFNSRIERGIFNDHKEFIEYALDTIDSPPIIVTHHAPIEKGTQRKEHENSYKSIFYVNKLDHLAERSLAWIFGHTHHVCDIYLPTGAVVTSNPIGAPEEELPFHKVALLLIEF
jgi:hypothetical protein